MSAFNDTSCSGYDFTLSTTGWTWCSFDHGSTYYYAPPEVPKWWRWFDVFRTQIRYVFAVTVAPVTPLMTAIRVHPLTDRRKWKRRRFIQALRAT